MRGRRKKGKLKKEEKVFSISVVNCVAEKKNLFCSLCCRRKKKKKERKTRRYVTNFYKPEPYIIKECLVTENKQMTLNAMIESFIVSNNVNMKTSKKTNFFPFQ